jgi:hypothetical protein
MEIKRITLHLNKNIAWDKRKENCNIPILMDWQKEE